MHIYPHGCSVQAGREENHFGACPCLPKMPPGHILMCNRNGNILGEDVWPQPSLFSAAKI